MKVYVSGPIHGRPDGNKNNFQQAADLLRRMGCEPVNPHHIDHDHRGEICFGKRETGVFNDKHKYGCYLMADLKILASCDAIVLLTGWEKSLGACAEREFAKALRIPEIQVEGMR